MSECMNYPENPLDFIKDYSFKDEEEIYTNGAMLVPLLRVEQMIEHYNNTVNTNVNNNGWISVNDRLPEKEDSYLVIGKSGGAKVTKWYKPSEYYPNGHFGGNGSKYIRYWMPRPEPPKNIETDVQKDIELLKKVVRDTNLKYDGQPLNPILKRMLKILKEREKQNHERQTKNEES